MLREGRPRLVVGSAGSLRLRGAIMQIVINVVAHGLGVREAIERTAGPLSTRRTVHVEGGNDPAEVDRLESFGYELARWRSRNLFFGGRRRRRAARGRDARGGRRLRRGGHGVVVA